MLGHDEGFDPYAATVASLGSGDPDENAGSLANLAEIVLACLDAVGARSVVEVGAYRGKLTTELMKWAEGVGGHVVAIDPVP
jgi:hypothetical protein